MSNPIVTLHMESGNDIVIELYESLAPNTVKSVVNTALNGNYNGSEFYRVVKDFVIQTGCSENDSFNMYSQYRIPGEFPANGFTTKQPKFETGVVGMCGLEPSSSDRTSFFIVTSNLNNRPKNRPSLNENYAAIGRVISGLDEVLRINEVETESLVYNGINFNTPKRPQVIKNVSVKTFGIEYNEPVYYDYDDECKDKIKGIGEVFLSK